MLPKPKESSSVKMRIGSLTFSSPHCLTGMPQALNKGKGHKHICSNFNTTPDPILTSPNILEMLFLHNARWSSDLYNVPASSGVMFMALPLTADNVFILYSIKHQNAAFSLHVQV